MFSSKPIMPVLENFKLPQFEISTDPTRDQLLTEFGKKTLNNQYLSPNETYQELFARAASTYCDNVDHAQRMYDIISNHWFMPATPILSNGGNSRGLPISCFLNEVEDSMDSIVDTFVENASLSSLGGGIGTYWGGVRPMGDPIQKNGSSSGIIPFLKVFDSTTLAISQGSLRRGASAVYLPISHPDIQEFITVRRPTGGDINRKCMNIHHGVVLSDDFMKAVREDKPWNLVSPHTGKVKTTVPARELWVLILSTRFETGEPFLIFIDEVNRHIPSFNRAQNLTVKTSNLCSEILLPTGRDLHDTMRTAVCCLSSLNLNYFDHWSKEPGIIQDCLRFLDNVLEDFIQSAPPEKMKHAIYAAKQSRAVGLGVMGFHSYLQSHKIPFESDKAKEVNRSVFSYISQEAEKASQALALEKGACPDAKACGANQRFSHKTAIAPTSSISIICGGASPGIEPYISNAYTHKTLSGSFSVRNPQLKKLLEEKGQNTEEVWSSISIAEGSVQHLDCLSSLEKEVFKTAFEINPLSLVELAAQRQPFICQGQSLNLFLPAGVHKQVIHDVHYQAWEKGVQSLYYLRSFSSQRAEKPSPKQAPKAEPTPQPATLCSLNEECLSCQ